jgi:hypothetical protein
MHSILLLLIVSIVSACDWNTMCNSSIKECTIDLNVCSNVYDILSGKLGILVSGWTVILDGGNLETSIWETQTLDIGIAGITIKGTEGLNVSVIAQPDSDEGCACLFMDIHTSNVTVTEFNIDGNACFDNAPVVSKTLYSVFIYSFMSVFRLSGSSTIERLDINKITIKGDKYAIGVKSTGIELISSNIILTNSPYLLAVLIGVEIDDATVIRSTIPSQKALIITDALNYSFLWGNTLTFNLHTELGYSYTQSVQQLPQKECSCATGEIICSVAVVLAIVVFVIIVLTMLIVCHKNIHGHILANSAAKNKKKT